MARKGKAVQVEVAITVRHRDKDYNLVGSGVTKALVLELEDFDEAVRRILKEVKGTTRSTVTRVMSRKLMVEALVESARRMMQSAPREGK